MDWLKGLIQTKHVWTPELISLRFSAPLSSYIAGQFVKLGLSFEEQIVGRPYSLVSAPHEPWLEVYFIIVPGGPLSPKLAQLEPGQQILVSPHATGFLTLAEIPDGTHLWLIATGTGIGPFLSILKTDTPWQRFQKLILVHAVRTAPELVYRECIDEISKARGHQFKYVPIVSRETTDFALSGRIPANILNGELEKKAETILEVESSRVMLCGNPAMITDTSATLLERGMKKHRRRDPGQILVETYW